MAKPNCREKMFYCVSGHVVPLFTSAGKGVIPGALSALIRFRVPVRAQAICGLCVVCVVLQRPVMQESAPTAQTFIQCQGARPAPAAEKRRVIFHDHDAFLTGPWSLT